MGFLQRKRRLSSEELDTLSDRYIELRGELLSNLADTIREFVHIAPDGRELDANERDTLTDRLRSGAQCLRVITRERALIEMTAEADQPRELDLRDAIQVLRRLQRAIVLSLSDDAERRRQVGPITNYQIVVRTVITDLGISI